MKVLALYILDLCLVSLVLLPYSWWYRFVRMTKQEWVMKFFLWKKKQKRINKQTTARKGKKGKIVKIIQQQQQKQKQIIKQIHAATGDVF